MKTEETKIKTETWFNLKSGEKIDFEESNISFIIQNKGSKDKKIHIKIK